MYVTVNKITYVTQRDELINEIIVKVAMLTRLDENFTKMPK